MMQVRERGQPQRPSAILIGPLVVVTPEERASLTEVMWGDIACALIADSDGRPDLSSAFVQGVENRLGTNPAHREALIAGDQAVLDRIRDQQARRQHFEADRARRLNIPLYDPGLSEKVQRLLAKASDHRQKAETLRVADREAKSRRNRSQITDHLAEARRLTWEAEQMAESDSNLRWLLGANAETVALAQARGEDVEHIEAEIAFEVRDEHGAVIRHKRGPNKGLPKLQYDRITRTVLASRGGGLEAALEKGHLDGRGPKPERLYDTGDKYREAYEIDEGHRSGQGGGAGGFGPKGPQLRIVEAGELLSVMRRGLSQREREVLDLVCGQDLRVRQAAERLGAGFPSTQRALRGGLQTALENWTSAKKAGQLGQAVEQVRAAARILRKARL